MSNDPIDDVLVDGENVSKSAGRSLHDAHIRYTVADANTVRNTDYSGKFGGLYVAATQIAYDIDTDDTTTEDDMTADSDCIRDAAGNAFKRTSSISEPSTVALGGVFSHAAQSHKFLTGIGTDGAAFSAQPDVTDLTGVDTDATLSADSDDKVASQKATKEYVTTSIAAYVAAQDVEVLKGSIDCSTNPDYPAADAGHVYRVSVAGKIGGASGPNVEVGDRLECFVDETASGDHATVGGNWIVSQVNIDGAVVGPTSSVDGELALFDGTSGRQIKRAGFTGLLKAASGVLSAATAGVDYLATAAIGATVQAYSALLAQIAALSSPGADRILFWDNSDSAWKFLQLGTNLSITGTVLNAASGGGSGGLSDAERQNFLLTTAYQSKSFATYRKLVNLFATGFKGANDTDYGIEASDSDKYAVTPGSAGAITGYVSPTFSDSRLSGGTPAAPLGGTAANLNDNNPATSTTTNGLGNTTGQTVAQRIAFKIDYGSNKQISKVELVGLSQSSGASSSNAGLYYSTDNTNWTVLGSANIGSTTTPTTKTWTGAAVTARYIAYAVPLDSFTAITTTAQDLNGYEPIAEDMTLVTAYQNADASVSNARALIEFDSSDSPTLNTDLIAEVTCDGGSNWASATLSSVTTDGQDGRSVAETADTSCTAGTSFAARIKTANGKNVRIYGAAVTVH